MRPRPVWTAATALLAACAGAAFPTAGPAPRRTSAATPRASADASARKPIRPPMDAFLLGLMPLASTGVQTFLATRPAADGRGVLIAILDSGIDPAVPGLIETSEGSPKLLDVRDFSGEGRTALAPVTATADGFVFVEGHQLRGAGRVRRVATGTQWYGGVLRELPLGSAPAADLNGNGTNTDVFPLVVIRAFDGWAVFVDTNLDGSLDDEMPLHDYRQGRETLALGTRPLTLAANFAESGGQPLLDFYFDTSGHGTHVAGIAAGHNLYDVAGFHGVAPGAQLLGLKIANNARGGLTTHGSVARALAYAARFADERHLPLVLNLSFGIGSEREGRAVIDSIVNAFLVDHPDVVFAISAGNDGPGLSTMGFPATADLALTVGATFPGAFARAVAPGVPTAPDGLGWWSAHGGDVAKPDLVAPGVAYSIVPRWNVGDEVRGGTSMSAPHVAGLAACLLSAMQADGRAVNGADVAQALVQSARWLSNGTVLGEGAGQPDLLAAYAWLAGGHQGSRYILRSTSGFSAALRPDGLSGPSDTLETFRVTHGAGLRAAQFLLRADVPWLSVPELVTAQAGTTAIAVSYRAPALTATGLHVGTVTALNPHDTLAGALFKLVNTVVVPHDLRSRDLLDRGRRIAAGRVLRYFLRAPTPGATLDVTVTLRDSVHQNAIVRLYEPGGRPFREVEEVGLGDEDPGTAALLVRAEDLVPGVYELTVVGRPLEPVTVDVRVRMAPLSLARSDTTLVVRNTGPAERTATMRLALVGAQRTARIAGRGAPAESLAVRAPGWAEKVEVDLELPVERWEEFTDFGLTVFDSAGQIVKTTPVNHAVARQRFDLPEALRGHPLTVELFPAYAWPDRTPSWNALVRVRFLTATPGPARDQRPVTVAAGAQVDLPIAVPPSLPPTDDLDPLVLVTLGDAVTRVPLRRGP